MIDKIRRLGTETAIYGVSTIVGRFLTFLLTPLYANLLAPGDLGLVATVYAYVAFLNVVYHYGMDTAYMKYISTLELGSRKETFTVPFISVVATSSVLSFLLWTNDRGVAELIGVGTGRGELIAYSSWILFLDAASYVPFAVLRMEHRAGRFASIRIVGIVVHVVFAALFLIEYRMGVPGIFLAGVLSSGVTLLMLFPTIIRNITLSWPRGMFRDLIGYGLPTLPAGLAAMMLQVIDRPILEALTDNATVGIYQANYRLGIFMMLIVSMFDFAWRPFLFSNAGDPNARKLFARVLTYFLLLMIGVFLLLAFFLDAFVRAPLFFGYSILPEAYRSGLGIVPIVLLAYIFLGMSTVLSAGLLIRKKTGRLPFVTISGAGLNVAANFLLIPLMGMHGAALATLISYCGMAILMYAFAQPVFPIAYEVARVAKLCLAGIAIYLAVMFLPPPFSPLVWRAVMMAAFFGLLYWMRFFEPSEIAGITSLFRPPVFRKVKETEPEDDSASGPENPHL